MNKGNENLTNKPLLRTIELCSGIGAQIKGINKTDLFDTEVIATADLDKEVVVSYAAIHCGLTNEMINNYEDYPSKEEMAEQLTQKRLGYDFKKDEPLKRILLVRQSLNLERLDREIWYTKKILLWVRWLQLIISSQNRF